MDQDTKEIIKRLEKCTASGHGHDEVFDDWLALAEACLERLPAHVASARRSGRPAGDIPQTVELFDRLRSKYGRYGRADYYFGLFSEALTILLDSVLLGYRDVLGDVYMAFAYPNPGAGQFFTPFPIAKVMAEMTIMDGAHEVHERLKDALSKSALGAAAALTGVLAAQDGPELAWDYFYNWILPAAAPHYRPVTVCDPAAGSGVMLLAAAACYPQWAVHLGLVQFFGQDIDLTCVRMARVNMMLYGLNGYGLKLQLAAYGIDPETLEEMPQGKLAREAPVPEAPDHIEDR